MKSTLKAVSNYRTFSSTAAAGNPQRVKRILSGVQPTGSLHLGNYLGAIKQWVDYQQSYDCFFCVVDLHALTVPQDPKRLRRDTLQAAAMYIACGIDPTQSKIFVQSHVSAHAELAWILNCITPISWLNRMIQYKEKSAKHGDSVGVGLFDYPVLMAADILLYQTDLVPVGEDQRQHLELARDIARRFNDQFCKNRRRVFRSPGTLTVTEGARVMSLQDGTQKMSKSAENDASRINLLDPPDVIQKKIQRCKSDSILGIEYEHPDRPEVTNLLNIIFALEGVEKKGAILQDVAGMNWSSFKKYLTDILIAHLTPIQQRYEEVMKEEAFLESILLNGQSKANAVANQTLTWTKNAVGLHMPSTAAANSFFTNKPSTNNTTNANNTTNTNNNTKQ